MSSIHPTARLAAARRRRADHALAIRALAAALSLTVLAACGGDGPTTPGSGSLTQDALTANQQRAQIQSALESPVLVSLLGAPDEEDGGFPFPVFSSVPGLAGPEAFLSLTRGRIDASLSVARPDASHQTASLPSARVAGAMAAAGVESFVDPSLWGQTFVRDGYYGYQVDATAKGAPQRGVRVMLYERLGWDAFTDVVVGYVDLIDSTTVDRQVGRANVYDVDGKAMGSLRFTLTEREAGSSTTVTMTLDGTLGASAQQFRFADTYSMTMGAGDSDLAMKAKTRTEAPFANVIVSMDMEYDLASMKFALEVRTAGRTLRMEASASMADMDSDHVFPQARLFLDGSLVGVADRETGELKAPNGGPVSSDLELFSAAVTEILSLTPIGVLEVADELTSILDDLW